jgi:hypothetical protein
MILNFSKNITTRFQTICHQFGNVKNVKIKIRLFLLTNNNVKNAVYLVKYVNLFQISSQLDHKCSKNVLNAKEAITKVSI